MPAQCRDRLSAKEEGVVFTPGLQDAFASASLKISGISCWVNSKGEQGSWECWIKETSHKGWEASGRAERSTQERSAELSLEELWGCSPWHGVEALLSREWGPTNLWSCSRARRERLGSPWEGSSKVLGEWQREDRLQAPPSASL
ncbi:UNVERIFIED_CONTAM: hypothetical protein FKN15_015782 [Acipenser sinensis]